MFTLPGVGVGKESKRSMGTITRGIEVEIPHLPTLSYEKRKF
jgi:hypothetical protein